MTDKATDFPGPDKAPDQNEKAAADDAVDRFQEALEQTRSNKIPEVYVGKMVQLNLTNGMFRPAIVLNINADKSLDLCVFFNGPKDYTLTGNTSPTAWYTTVQFGIGDGQWSKLL